MGEVEAKYEKEVKEAASIPDRRAATTLADRARR